MWLNEILHCAQLALVQQFGFNGTVMNIALDTVSSINPSIRLSCHPFIHLHVLV